MSVTTKPEVASTLEKAGEQLRVLASNAESEIGAVGKGFESLARHSSSIVSLAAAIVECVEDESVLSVLPRVQTLGAAARGFIQDRLQATAGILETVTAEAKLLARLSQLTLAQRSIARETQTLSVLTNIEVARLGQLGAGFQYLAHELDDFSQAVAKDTKELTRHTDERRTAIEATRRMLAIELPRMHQEFARIEVDLGTALAVVDADLTQLSKTPAQFRVCVEEIADQIAGVVAAIQSYDITRQQIEHVEEAFTLIVAKWSGEEAGDRDGEGGTGPELPWIAASLAIQAYQLKNVAQTVDGWIAQIRMCMEGILRISSSEVVAIGPAVLAQERELSSQMERIERLELECQADNEKVQGTLSGLSNLIQLVSEHLVRSKSVRDRLQLLTFNSIIEASRLGAKADAILEISQSIKRISIAWSELTDRSGQVMEEILSLVERSKGVADVFSQAGNAGLEEAQAATQASLENLRTVAAFAGGQATEIEAATARMQAQIALVGASGDKLEASFGSIGRVLGEVEELRRALGIDRLDAHQRCDRKEVERLFSGSYTTEMERAVLRAALAGDPLPAAQQNLVGNSVELF